MPPHNPHRVIWQYVSRKVRRVHVDPLNGKSWKVTVTFIRVGMYADTQERVEESTGEYVVAEKLGPNQAADLVRTVELVCDHSYSQGHSAARNAR
jgi:hypothetical protein